MAKLRLSIHPLFFIFGIYFALTGRVFVFLVYTIVAVVHELGHSLAAARLGYRLNRIVLMPYGAMVSGEIRGLKLRDEINVAFAGPLTNLACAVFFVAMWWVLPETYAYTDIAVTASLSIATVNLLPCRPLDGGRILHSILSLYVKQRTADIVLLVSGVAFSCVLGGLFVYSCFTTVNFSILFFALFAFFGTVFTGKKNKYVRIYESFYTNSIERGAEVKTIAVTTETTVKRLLCLVGTETLTEVHVFNENGERVKIISPKEFCDMICGDTLYKKIKDVI